MRTQNRYFFECVNCGSTFEEKEISYLCPKCETQNAQGEPLLGVLKVIYPYEKWQKIKNLSRILRENMFLKFLPLKNIANSSFLRVGFSPFYEVSLTTKSFTNKKVFLKDDSQNPTFSFKDRASTVVSHYAREKNFNTIVVASTGNAGASIAGICASQKQKAIVVVPASAPKAKLTQILMYGATLVPIAGNYDKAFDLSIELSKEFGWYNRNTAFNSLTIEGKKTVSLELFSDFRKFGFQESENLRIFVPVGDGAIISGVYKGFEDLLKSNLIEEMPKIIAVQASGSANIVNNLETENPVFPAAKTVADSISVDIPRNFFMTKNFLKTYNGEGILVDDENILYASKILSQQTGIFTEPAAATAVAGFIEFHRKNPHSQGRDVILLTGSGLKDLNAVQPLLELPDAVEATVSAVKNFLKL